MANKIQIKRSTANATVTGLANGELAFTGNGNIIYIGDPAGSGTSIRIGGQQVPGVLTANQALVANSSSSIDKVITANLVPTQLYANGSFGTGGQILATSGTTGNVYWVDAGALATSPAGANTQIQFNDSGVLGADADFTWNKTTNTLSALNISGNGASITSVNADTVGGNTAATLRSYSDTVAGTAYSNAVTYAASNTYVNTTFAPKASPTFTGTVTAADLTVNGNTVLGDATSDVVSFTARVNTSINPSANITYNLGTNTLRWYEIHAANVHSVSGYFDGNVQVAGDLVVSGNVTTTNVASVIVSDPLIYLAGNNYSSDLVDIGFAGNYNDGTNRHTGLFRDATDGIYKLFNNLTQELSGATTVDTGDATYRTAILEAFLQSSGLTTNATHVVITANSTVNVAITANTLTLATALSGTSGGTGLSSYTSQDLLVANSTNGFSALGIGSEGYVLQVSSGVVAWNTLDGGTF